jgi:hypothetical protein
MIESNEHDWARGDGGCAFGLVQMHPAAFWGCYGRHPARFRPDVHDTWATAMIKACAAYLAVHNWTNATAEKRDLVVAAWNQGEHAVFVEGKRAPEYVRKWHAAYKKITQE